MAVAHVQKRNAASSSTTSVALAYTSSVTSGNGLQVCISLEASTATISSVSDDVNGSWTQAVENSHTSPSNNRQAIYYYDNAGAGTTTVTVSTSASCTLTISIFETSGLNTGGSLGDTSFGTGTDLEVTPGSVTPTVADNIVYGQANSLFNSLSAKTGYTLGYANSSEWYSANQYKVTASTSAEEPYLSAAATSGYNAVAAIFQAAGGGGGPAAGLRTLSLTGVGI